MHLNKTLAYQTCQKDFKVWYTKNIKDHPETIITCAKLKNLWVNQNIITLVEYIDTFCELIIIAWV